jgi:hypothetical protein
MGRACRRSGGLTGLWRWVDGCTGRAGELTDRISVCQPLLAARGSTRRQRRRPSRFAIVKGLAAVVGASSMSVAASYSSRKPGTSVVRNLPDVRNVQLERGFQFALYRLLAKCHAARRTSTTRRSSGLPPSGRTPNNGSSSRLRSGLDVGGRCALAPCLRPRPSRWPWRPHRLMPPVGSVWPDGVAASSSTRTPMGHRWSPRDRTGSAWAGSPILVPVPR